MRTKMWVEPPVIAPDEAVDWFPYMDESVECYKCGYVGPPKATYIRANLNNDPLKRAQWIEGNPGTKVPIFEYLQLTCDECSRKFNKLKCKDSA